MQSKKTRAQQFLQAHDSVFRCPLCHTACQATASGLICVRGHQFDLAKKGTLFFLPHPVKTEYDHAMLAARGRMIRRGLFKPMLAQIAAWLPSSSDLLIDVGCGEGSFLQQLAQDRPLGPTIGFDISKPGIYLASDQQLSQSFFCVADLTNLPFTDHSVTTLLNIFSPSHYQEFARVLTPGGSFIKVIPGPHYLQELRAAYLAQPKQAYSNQPVLTHLAKEATIIESKTLQYQFTLPDQAAFGDLQAMSPLAWQASTAQKEILAKQPFSKITIDLQLVQCRPHRHD